MAIWDVAQRTTLFNEASDREVWLPHHQWDYVTLRCTSLKIFCWCDCSFRPREHYAEWLVVGRKILPFRVAA